MNEVLAPTRETEMIVLDPDNLCHVTAVDSHDLLCGAVNRDPGHSCGEYDGMAICPNCGKTTCPTCAMISALEDEIDDMLETT